MRGENGPPLDGWCCTPHRPAPCMNAPAIEPSEDHLIRGTE